MNLDKICEVLSKVPGVCAVALGGSQSRNEADAASDFDIGLYYPDGALDLEALENCFRKLDDGHRSGLLNPPGDWGRWINGGGWLHSEGMPVDILLRETGRAESVLRDCLSGRITIDYQCGHPFGFVNTIYAAETHFCRILWQDGSKPLTSLKNLLYSEGPYAPLMKKGLIEKFTWEAGFSLACGRKPSMKNDFNYAAGSVFRTVCSWIEVLYALNEVYLMNEKGALGRVNLLGKKPEAFELKVRQVYKALWEGKPEFGYDILEGLQNEIEQLLK